jgi:ABC-type multidrug transport system fused ATPase/permease subunit
VGTKTKLDKVSSYFAHSALRQMVLKPMLLAYIVVMHFVEMRWKWTPFVAVMFSIIVFPKFATCTRHNYKDVLLETGASILQFTPEAIVGTIRVLSAVKAHLAGAAIWVPQRSVEEESKVSNPFIFSLRYLWYYSAFALVWGLRVGLWAASVGPEAMFIITILGTLFMLPLYVGFTSLPANSLRAIASGRSADTGSKEDTDGGKIADTTDAALQALRVRLPKMRLRQLQSQSYAGNPRRHEAAVNVSQAAALAIGSRGVRISTGDRARIALARAAYSKRSNLVLIDDPFTMVDIPTGMHILHKLIRGPMMQGRTRIVAMQPYLDYLEHFDRVLVLQEGRVVAEGAPADMQVCREFQELQAKVARDQSLEALQATKPFVTMNLGDFPLKLCEHGTDRATEKEVQQPPNWEQLRTVIMGGGIGRLILAMLSVIGLRLMAQAQMVLLGRWADQAQEMQEVGGTYYILMTGVVVTVSVFHVLQGYSILAFNNNTSRNVFRTSFSTLLKAPLDAFWDKQPVGRVIGRLSGDLMNIDMALSHGCVAATSICVDFIVQQVFCLILLPIWIVVPTYLILYGFFRLFWNTAVQMQLQSALAISRCQEEQAQLSNSRLSIHAFQYEAKMVAQYCSHAGSIVTPDGLASYAKIWVISRITFCLCFQSTVCVLIGILQPETLGIGSLAVIMAATFHIVQQLNGFFDCLINIFSVAVSLQRIADLADIPQEAPDQFSGDEQKRNRLVAAGIGVRLENCRVGFAGGPDVLTSVNIDIQPRTKVVIAGAPGCGKTTILNCILRLVDPRAGRILFNGTDTRTLGLLTLRSMIGLVPQETSIFRGSIRFNIDPFRQYPDERIWAAIQCAQLLPTVRRLTKGLDHVLTDDGNNFSHGQKQLLSLARAVCQQPPLLLLDECCSALDPRTQESVQDTIMLNFPNSTIIGTTCRMDDITNFNHVVVLEKGTVVRQGPVGNLLQGRMPVPATVMP